jgi:hypothetical protein
MTQEHEGSDEVWADSTEGDLDPDLAEESAYSDWDAPPHRPWWPLFYRAMAILLIAALVLPAILMLLR